MISVELTVFTKHYSKLCNTLTDIDRLSSHLVDENIIKHEDLEEINALVLPAKKVQKLLTHISGPLRAGSTEGFHIMLRIMGQHGHQATQQLASQIKRSLYNHNKLSTDYSNFGDIAPDKLSNNKIQDIQQSNAKIMFVIVGLLILMLFTMFYVVMQLRGLEDRISGITTQFIHGSCNAINDDVTTRMLQKNQSLLNDNDKSAMDIHDQRQQLIAPTEALFQITPVILSIRNKTKYDNSTLMQTFRFLTFEKGHLMGMEVFLNGFDAKSTVLLYLMKGPHDDKLEKSGHWPLRGMFVIELLSQSYLKENHKRFIVINSDTCIECANRVMHEGDTAKPYGSHFISKNNLYDYWSNETLYFKVSYSSCSFCGYLSVMSLEILIILPTVVIVHAFMIFVEIAFVEIFRNHMKTDKLAIAIYIFNYDLLFWSLTKDAFRNLVIGWIFFATEVLGLLIIQYTHFDHFADAIFLFISRMLYVFFSSKAVYAFESPHTNQATVVVCPIVVKAFIPDNNFVAQVIFQLILLFCNLVLNILNVL